MSEAVSAEKGLDGPEPEGGAGGGQDAAVPITAWEKLMNSASATGVYIFTKMEAIGEGVADILGLNDSKFQYVIDSMDDKDWDRARAVDAKRRKEDFERGKFKNGVAGMPASSNHIGEGGDVVLPSIYDLGNVKDSENSSSGSSSNSSNSCSNSNCDTSKVNDNVSVDGIVVTFEDVMREQKLLEESLRQGLSMPDRQRVQTEEETDVSTAEEPVEVDIETASGIDMSIITIDNNNAVPSGAEKADSDCKYTVISSSSSSSNSNVNSTNLDSADSVISNQEIRGSSIV